MAVTAHEWQATAAYFYVLHLDPGSLAWEYLRRNSKYVHDWKRGARHRARAAIRWELRFPCRPAAGCAHRASDLAGKFGSAGATRLGGRGAAQI